MADINDKFAKHKIIPVIALDNADDSEKLAEALISGGLPVAEITFRTAAAEESIKRVSKAFPDMLVGAGTVMNAEQAKRAMEAGAKFVVTAGFSKEVAGFCFDNELPLFPGVCTPTELMFLAEFGLKVAKFFPAVQFGGVATLKAFSGPFTDMRFIPTGGISDKNILEFLAFPKVLACGGSWMVKKEMIAAGDFAGISALTAKAVELVG
ncbi:MAG: bifunctional 4-hydroxy-2-oxoglutarate aldolase/2-dehydro-3-deoxy-phosphogluconate aldolase [Lachnospiraceae bacterium]|nr:bifunctional 4-hydroxy-2-oxoglutarate aldolase/2-dehydro-3-deoxy-phosphogluconate aldolase [Lachnospiraceae bacterium]